MSTPTKLDIPIPESISSTDATIHDADSDVKLECGDHRSKADRKDISDDAQDILAAAPDVEVDLENAEGAELKRKPSTIVPRKNRRGLFGQFVVGIPEIEDPVEYSRRIKTFIVFIIAIAAVAAPMGYLTTPIRDCF